MASRRWSASRTTRTHSNERQESRASNLDDEGDKRLCFDALLVREPTNAYDARAVAVYSPVGIIGYTPRGAEWCDLLDLLATQGYDAASCRANLCGGDGGKSWGVVLHARPEIEAERLADQSR